MSSEAAPARTESPRPGALSPHLGACALLGALSGAAAAGLDLLCAARDLGSGGPLLSLWLFLASLYGSACAALAVVMAALRRALLNRTALGAGSPVLVPRRALLASAIGGALSLGPLIYGPARYALLSFRHRTLIALLVGALATALSLLLFLCSFLLIAVLSRAPWLRGGARVRLAPFSPLLLYGAGLWLGLLLLVGAVSGVLSYLQWHPRMNPHLRALNLALAAPLLWLLCLGAGHFTGRALQRLRPPLLPTLGVSMLLPAGLFFFGYRDTLRLVDLRPFTTVGAAALGFLALMLLPARLRPRIDRGAHLLLIPLLFALALRIGQEDRVRKAALGHAALSRPLVQSMQAVFDLDGDGYPSRFVIGGSDCDDLDPAVHPGAFDWPGDEQDDNCNGHVAVLPARSPRAFLPLPASVPARPNIVLITIDALRADHAGCYGYPRPTTPALDSLAREGLLMKRSWAHAPSTRYSVPAILAGRYPSTIAWGAPAVHWPPEVLPENRLIQEALRERGYRTIALLSYHYFEPAWGLAQGFDDYDVHLQTLHSMGGDPAATSGSSARELADLAISKLEQENGERPFFLWAHFYDPHYRYEPHEGAPVFGGGRTEIDRYDAEVRYTDDQIGRLLGALHARGLWERTVVVITADHGEGFGEHGIPPSKRHGYHLYANQTRVPLVMRVPGIPPMEIEEPAGHVDIFPTLLHLAGGKSEDEPQLPGSSLVDLAIERGNGPARRFGVFQEVMYEGPTVRKAVATRDYHLIKNLIPDGTTELYDLREDPGEERDLAGRRRDVEAELGRALAEWMDQSAIPEDFATRVHGSLSFAPIPAARSVGGRIGGMLELVGVGEHDHAVSIGGELEVTLIWKGLRSIPPGWRLFTHLVTSDGRFVNADHDPVGGLVPLQRVRPGQYIKDVVRIPIGRHLPAGRAQLLVGLYRKGERAPTSGPAEYLCERRDCLRAMETHLR